MIPKLKIFSLVAGVYKVVNLDTMHRQNIKAAGKLRYLNLSPVVGDYVKISGGLITEILPRKNYLVRPNIANIDQMIICMSVYEPEFSSFLLDKYLSILEFKNIKPVIFITKADLDIHKAKEWQMQYQQMGYEVYLIDNTQKIDNSYKFIFKDKFSAFMGQSGVGKTTTLNKLTNLNFETQSISKALGRGKHTTRQIQIINFQDGFLIDTPGFSALKLDLDKYQLAKSFELFQSLAKTCKYRSCLHVNEPEDGCAIKLAALQKIIPFFRYQNYLKLQNELTNQK